MLNILKPKIFELNKIDAGVTQLNYKMFPGTGLSLAANELLSDDITQQHIHIFAHSRGINISKIKMLNQIHSDIVHIVNEKTENLDGDALITNISNVMLVVKIADCAAVMIHDKVRGVIAAIHSGWKGTYLNIVNKTIQILNNKFKSRPEDLSVFISPCASVKKYKVGEEFLEMFPNSVISKGKHLYFDNRKELANQLLQAGVIPENIEISNICTIQNGDYHSYRRDGAKSGRMAAFIMLK